jgi:DNA-binding MarR family transcriptional regulator
MLITEKYDERISGTLTCYDRIIIQGVIPNWSYADGMTGYFYGNDMKIFDYAKFSQPLTENVRTNAERIAKEEDIEIEFIRKLHAFRKDDKIQEIIKAKGITEGLVHIFSAMEKCNTYKPWHDKDSGRTFFKFDTSTCLHYYFYFIDRDLGLCYMRVPTWCPFRLQFYVNGHNLLASKLRKKNIEYEMLDNAFIQISDFEMAQKLSNRFNPEDLHKALDLFAKRYCPTATELGMSYSWTIMQIECATDIVFKNQEYLQPMYDEIIKTAIHTVRPDNIATFLGQRITYNCKKEVGTNFNQRILGTRIKHHMGDVSIKMYDKFGLVLRIESTCNDVGAFRVNRDVQHNDGSVTVQKAPMRKSIYSLYLLFTIMKAANYRYLEFISSFDDHSDGEKKLSETTASKIENGRSYRGFNFFNAKDLRILDIIDRGEFNIHGFQNIDIRRRFGTLSSSAVSRIIKRLHLHGFIERVKGTYKYFLTTLGKSVVVAGLKVKNLIIVPALAQAEQPV